MPRAFQPVLTLGAFLLLSATAVYWVFAYQIADADTADDVTLARACVELGNCPARGTENAAQQVLGVHNGRAFIRLISYALRTGSGLKSVQIVFLALLIFSAAVSWWIARRYVSPAAALLLLLWYLQPIAVTMRLHVLTKATILPLPLAVYYASIALLAESGGAGAAAVASAALAAAVTAELSCMILVTLHVAFVALFARRPFATCLASCMVLAFTFTLDSSDVSREILGLIAEKVFGLTVLAAAVVVLALSPLRERAAAAWVQLRERLAALPVRSRWRAVMKATVIYANTAVWIGCVLVQSRGPQEQYHGPLVFGLLFLAVDACESLSRRRIIVLSLLGSVALVLFAFAPFAPLVGGALLQALSAAIMLASLVWVIGRALAGWGIGSRLRRFPAWLLGSGSSAAPPPRLAVICAGFALLASIPDLVLFPRERQVWPVGASEALANGLYDKGMTFSQLMGALDEQSFGVFGALDYMVAHLDPNLFGAPQPAVNPGWSLLALLLEPAAVARTQGVVLTFPVMASRAAVVVQAPSYLDRTRVRTCSTACGGEPQPQDCNERMPNQPLQHRSPYFQLTNAADAGSPPEARGCIVVFVPLRTLGTGVPHFVRVSDEWPLQSHIRRVSGVEFEGPLPGPEVRLRDEHQSTGSMEIEVTQPGPDRDRWNVLRLIEVTQANEHLLEPFRGGRATSW